MLHRTATILLAAIVGAGVPAAATTGRRNVQRRGGRASGR